MSCIDQDTSPDLQQTADTLQAALEVPGEQIPWAARLAVSPQCPSTCASGHESTVCAPVRRALTQLQRCWAHELAWLAALLQLVRTVSL